MAGQLQLDVSRWAIAEWKNCEVLYSSCEEFLSEIPPRTAGVYHIYTGEELSYVGCSVNMKSRLTDHLVRGTNTQDWINEATSVTCFLISDKYEREMREYADILNLSPTYNKRLPSLRVINKGRK